MLRRCKARLCRQVRVGKYFVLMCTLFVVQHEPTKIPPITLVYCFCYHKLPGFCNRVKVTAALRWQLNRGVRSCSISFDIVLFQRWFGICSALSISATIGGGRPFPYLDLRMTAVGRKFGFLCWTLSAMLSVSVLCMSVQTVHPIPRLPSPSATVK